MKKIFRKAKYKLFRFYITNRNKGYKQFREFILKEFSPAEGGTGGTCCSFTEGGTIVKIKGGGGGSGDCVFAKHNPGEIYYINNKKELEKDIEENGVFVISKKIINNELKFCLYERTIEEKALHFNNSEMFFIAETELGIFSSEVKANEAVKHYISVTIKLDEKGELIK